MFSFFYLLILTMACLLFYFLPGEPAKKSILIFLCELPLWGFYTLKRLTPLNRTELPEGLWRSKFIFTLFLGFGLGILFFVFGLIVLSFLVAISGQEVDWLYRYLFPLLKGAPLLLAFFIHNREVERLYAWGLDYRERIAHETPGPDDDITTQGMGETLRMLTILDLEPDLSMDDLKARYRELVKLYHPDRLAGMGQQERETAEQEFKRIKRAYELVKAQIEKGKL